MVGGRCWAAADGERGRASERHHAEARRLDLELGDLGAEVGRPVDRRNPASFHSASTPASAGWTGTFLVACVLALVEWLRCRVDVPDAEAGDLPEPPARNDNA